MRHPIPLALALLAVVALPVVAGSQQAIATTDVNVRSGQSTSSRILGHLRAGDTVSLLSTTKRRGYYHIEERDTTRGWVYARFLRRLDSTATAPAPVTSSHANAGTPGTPGSSATAGCGDHLWRHVYNPQRLLVKEQCVTVRGTIVDATNGRENDGARHEGDGDTHGWIRLDPEFRDMLNAGNNSDEGGNLVFEIVCHYTVTQADAKPPCSAYTDHTAIPAVGTHVEITGTYVEDSNHARWNEIHPVSKFVVKP